jgi:hypothetical protein
MKRQDEDDDVIYDEQALLQIDTAVANYHNKRKKKIGRVCVAKYYPGKQQPAAKKEGFVTVLIHTSPGGLGGDLSPYVLRNEKGQLLENIWQFSKLYARVDAQRIPLSKQHHPDKIIWEHPAEVHALNQGQEVTDAYWKWREKGMNNAYAVRYPNGFYGRTRCICSIWENEKLDYISARKRIYCGEYARLAPATASFKKLSHMLHEQGKNLLLVEVDGPDPDLNYPPYDQISREKPCMEMNAENIRLLINDPKKPFGHGFVIAALLLYQDDLWWMQ